jgi:CheY-like chemotaxis protein
METAKKPKILIVDDEEKNHRLMTAILKNLSCVFDTARDGREAILKTVAFGPDLIFLDIMLPEMDGYAVCRLLKDNPDTRTIPIIMVTALDDKGSKLRALEAGANDFLTKPVDGTEVIFYQLESGRYIETPNSLAFPALDAETATQFLEQSQKLKSTVWLRIHSANPRTRMPPAKAARQLTDRDRAILRRWIEQGAIPGFSLSPFLRSSS